MAELEVKASENVMEACAMTPSVRKCVLTSSLLASVWQDTVKNGFSHVINHEHWSKESVCVDKKVYIYIITMLGSSSDFFFVRKK